MTRTLKLLAVLFLAVVGKVAFADTYELSATPDLFIDYMQWSDGSLIGNVESIADQGNCAWMPCTPLSTVLTYVANGSGFEVTGADADDPALNGVWLAGTLVASMSLDGGEYGEMYQVTTDDASKWNALEGQVASSFGSYVVVDYHDMGFQAFSDLSDGGDTIFADLAPPAQNPPAPIPEPATITLALSGIVAGLARSWARKRQTN